MKFTHKNIEITVNDRAQFVATVQGARVVKPSLDAMKKHIDDMLAKAFVPFKAIIEPRFGKGTDLDGFAPVNVVGLQKSDHTWRRNKLDFIIEYVDKKQESISSVLVDTPENRKAAIAARQYDEETTRIKDQRDKKLKELRAKIQHRDPEDQQP